jgi:dipeptidyl aminopeptidase/acylaminoacyl peptidase
MSVTLPRRIAVEELFADPEFSGASISPDGTKLAYLAPAHGKLNVWVRGIDEEHEDAICVTHATRRGIHRYDWTDDPRRLLYLQDTDGNEDWHLYRIDLEHPDEPSVDLTPLPPGSRVGSFELSKSHPGTVVVTMNERPLFFDVFRIDIATGETTLIREENDPLGRRIGPDGTVRFRVTQAEDGTHQFYAVDREPGEERLVFEEDGPTHPIGPYPQQPSPDGSALLLGVYLDSDTMRLVRLEHATGETTVVAEQPGSSLCNMGWAAEFGYTPTLFTSRRTGEVIAARFVGDRPLVKVVDPDYADVFDHLSQLSDGVLGWLSSDDSEQRWVATFVHDRDPGLTYLYDRSTGESRLLFRPYPNLDPNDLAPMTAVRFTARDGLPLHGFLTLPVGVEPKSLPLVLHPHGGPWAHDSWGYSRDAQLLANRGYAVLQVNFRGSTGYGKRHITAAIGELAGRMHDDLIDACDWAVQQGIADPSRLGIFGGSYGGYSALVGVTFTPDYFAAAVDYVGVSSWITFMRAVPEWYQAQLKNNWVAYAGDPDDPEQAADLLARSPVSKVDEIRTPLLVVQGAKDARVPQAESDVIVDSLRARGVPVEYIVAEDEGHDFKNPENLIAMYRAIERHFDTYLGGQ